METKPNRTQGWKLILAVILWFGAMCAALGSDISTWIKIALLLGSAVAIWAAGPGLETPNYEPQEWDVERD